MAVGQGPRVLLTGGGTGGHVYPALVTAEEIKLLAPGAEFLYVGTQRGIEARLVPAHGIQFATVYALGLMGKRSIDAVRGMVAILRGYREATQLIRRFRPHVVLGTGGYVTAPVILAAYRHRVPVVIQEQNVLPGMANKVLSRCAAAVAIPFPAARSGFTRARRLVVTGNPVRRAVMDADPAASRRQLGFNEQRPLVLVVGGSSGALTLNRAAVELITTGGLCAQLLLVTGPRYFELIRTQLHDAGLDEEKLLERGIRVVAYMEQMELALAAATIVVARAGATTIAEITARSLPSVLIPSPNVAHNHQQLNAEQLARAGAARIVPDHACNGQRLHAELRKLLDDEHRLQAMGRAAKTLARPAAGQDLANLVLEIAGWRRRPRANKV